MSRVVDDSVLQRDSAKTTLVPVSIFFPSHYSDANISFSNVECSVHSDCSWAQGLVCMPGSFTCNKWYVVNATRFVEVSRLYMFVHHSTTIDNT